MLFIQLLSIFLHLFACCLVRDAIVLPTITSSTVIPYLLIVAGFRDGAPKGGGQTDDNNDLLYKTEIHIKSGNLVS